MLLLHLHISLCNHMHACVLRNQGFALLFSLSPPSICQSACSSLFNATACSFQRLGQLEGS